jgi:hypothetical protein
MTHLLKFAGTPPTFTAGLPFPFQPTEARLPPTSSLVSPPCWVHATATNLSWISSSAFSRDAHSDGDERGAAPMPAMATAPTVLAQLDVRHATRNRCPPVHPQPLNPSSRPIRAPLPSFPDPPPPWGFVPESTTDNFLILTFFQNYF